MDIFYAYIVLFSLENYTFCVFLGWDLTSYLKYQQDLLRYLPDYISAVIKT